MIARFSAELVLDNLIKRTNAAIKNLSAKSDKTDIEKGQILGMTDALAILNGEIAKERERVKY
jgi:hypothetical protein